MELYDSELLKGFQSEASLDPTCVVRPLHLDDYEKGYLELLKQLTTVGEISEAQFKQRFLELARCEQTYYITVVENIQLKKIICCGTLFVERKYIHEMAQRGHIEDIVVDSEFRGKKLGKLIVDVLTHVAIQRGCYKISLDCDSKNICFYQKCGYIHDDKCFMYRRFDE
eukprot:Sdes_comp8908_c0_seq1m309